MGAYSLDFRFLEPYLPAFFYGAFVALEMSILSFIFGTICGLPIAIFLFRGRLKGLVLLLNDVLRALPPLVVIFFVYFFPYEILFGVTPPNAVMSVTIALAISQAAYTADLYYYAQNNVSPRLIEGGRALGLKEFDIWRYLVLPDISRQMLPAQLAFFIGILRLSSLGAVIGAEEVVYVARIAIAQNFRSLEAWILVGAIYAVIVTPFTVVARYVERSEWVKRRF